MSIPEFKQQYKNYLKELAEGNDLFNPAISIARIVSWHSKIANFVSNDTGEDMQIIDVPAGWGNCGFYRLLSGNNQGGANGEANFFSSKISSLGF
jgi:ubiquinone/menaquinone biosynthesis C-methylase UbiE